MASIRKRKNSYQITVSNGYDATGRKLTETTTFTPDPTKTEKQNQKALEIFAFEFEQKVRSGNYLDGEKLLLKDYAVRWLSEYAEKQLAYSTYSNYKMNIESRIIPSLGHMKMSQIKPLHIQAMYNALLSDTARNDGKSGRLSTGTIKKVHAILSSMLHTAVLWQIIESNPCDRVAPPANQEQRSTCPKHFTLEQADAFIKALDMDIQTNYCDRRVQTVPAICICRRLPDCKKDTFANQSLFLYGIIWGLPPFGNIGIDVERRRFSEKYS